MKIDFFKYHGAGNDFIIIDNRFTGWIPGLKTIARLCDRHLGIGADGFMLLSVERGYDFGMTYFNSDGRESTLCGNGGRCIAAFAHFIKIAGDRIRFHAIDGEHIAVLQSPSEYGPEVQVHLRMSDPSPVVSYSDGFFTDTGSPHFVVPVSGVSDIKVFEAGQSLRNDPRFLPGGTNVDFAEIRNDHLFVRTYERGVENETLSCGTGVTASAIVAATLNPLNSGRYRVTTLGGELSVRFSRTDSGFSEVWLEGPARFVFTGSFETEHLEEFDTLAPET